MRTRSANLEAQVQAAAMNGSSDVHRLRGELEIARKMVAQASKEWGSASRIVRGLSA
jgi:hypothetical protein